MAGRKRDMTAVSGVVTLDPDIPDYSDSKKKVLSCQRCRLRKVKCNFEFPCSSCVRVGVECVQVTDDKRKKRLKVTQISELQERYNNLVQFLQQVQESETSDQKQQLLELPGFESLLRENGLVLMSVSKKTNGVSSATKERSADAEEEDAASNTHRTAVYGPTAVYDDDSLISRRSTSLRGEVAAVRLLNRDELILQCIKLFFNWQYPDHNMFIFRESFLIDFFNPKPNMMYCSKVLVLAICALGSSMSEVESIYNRSKKFYDEAKSLLLSQLDHPPSITSMQLFLLLAFYDICNGHNSSGWMLSGNAIRMGYDLGFQLNPKVWFMHKVSADKLTESIRSRIYWGSYMADHFISLLLGRPSLLKKSDASIPELEDLPDLDWIDEYIYNRKSDQVSYISNPLKKIIVLISISDNILSDIFTKDEFNLEDSRRLDKLYQYNVQIRDWKESLPDDLKWDRQSLKETAENPTLAGLRYYYYILVLCLNRPFVGLCLQKRMQKQKVTGETSDEDEGNLSPIEICEEAIGDLYVAINRFQKVHGLRRVSIFIVYSSILAISILLLTNTYRQLVTERKKKKLLFFLDVLRGSSKTWKLAEKSYNLIQMKLKFKKEERIQEEAGESPPPTPSVSEAVSTPPLIKEERMELRPISPVVSNLRSVSEEINSEVGILSNLYPILAKILGPQVPSTITTQPIFNSTPVLLQTRPISKPQMTPYPVIQRMPINVTNDRFQFTLDNRLQSSEDASGGIGGGEISSSVSLDSGGVNGAFEIPASVEQSNTDILFEENLDFFGGPPMLMTSDLFNEDWEALFPDYVLKN